MKLSFFAIVLLSIVSMSCQEDENNGPAYEAQTKSTLAGTTWKTSNVELVLADSKETYNSACDYSGTSTISGQSAIVYGINYFNEFTVSYDGSYNIIDFKPCLYKENKALLIEDDTFSKVVLGYESAPVGNYALQYKVLDQTETTMKLQVLVNTLNFSTENYGIVSLVKQ